MSMDADERDDTSIWCYDGACAACEDEWCEHDCHYEEDAPGRGPVVVARILSSITAALIGAAAVVYTWREVLPEFPMPPLTALAAKGIVLLLVGALTVRTILRITTREVKPQ